MRFTGILLSEPTSVCRSSRGTRPSPVMVVVFSIGGSSAQRGVMSCSPSLPLLAAGGGEGPVGHDGAFGEQGGAGGQQQRRAATGDRRTGLVREDGQPDPHRDRRRPQRQGDRP